MTHHADEFDHLYKAARDRLLVEAYALTGDLGVARASVRDAFTVAWHHWNVVQREDDRVAWLRPRVWRRARNRHTARPWHKEKNLPESVAATLAALDHLSGNQRKALVLTHLSPVPEAEMAREIGVPRDSTARLVEDATSAFTAARGTGPDEVAGHLVELRTVVTGRWPRSTILRRAGTARRRTRTVTGVLGTVALVIASGTLVAQGDTGDAALENQGFSRRPVKVGTAAAVPELDRVDLLSPGQLGRVDRTLSWSEGETHDNTEGDGLVLPCQRASFADADGLGAWVRTFTGAPDPKARKGTRTQATAVEMTELSRNEESARSAYATALDWFTSCSTERTQLLKVEEVRGVGDEASVVTLRDWREATRTVRIATARTGQVVTTTVSDVAGDQRDTRPAAELLGAAVNALCGSPGSGTCAAPPSTRSVGAPQAGEVPGMLSEFDLPPIKGARGPWVGTEPSKATKNFAATRCDNTSFSGGGITHNLTRTFLFPQEKGTRAFGLTQTVGMTKDATAARRMVKQVRSRIAKCADEPGTTIRRLAEKPTKDGSLTAWTVKVPVSDSRSLEVQMAIIRSGTTVSQVGFVPTSKLRMGRDDFTALAGRAQERLPRLSLEEQKKQD